ncbi:oxidoreductase [Whalleya microplaca]|nr:oxidoreductase [Whalleya microplaca]
MVPIGVGFIGLRASTLLRKELITLPGYWGANAHLPSIQVLPEDYQIVAVLNSSVESSKKAIECYGLPEGTKAYGNPEDLANDPRVQLVVISVDVRKHYMLAKPALLAKKDVFVEWPLAATLAQSEELTKLAADAGVRTMVCTQARGDPLIVKLKQLLASGKIGRVISSSVIGSASFLPVDSWMAGGEYYLDINSGANEFFVTLGHFLDTFVDVLGDFADVNALMKTFFPIVPIYNSKGELVNRGYKKTAPDHMLIHGTLESEAVASIALRKTVGAVDEHCFRWIITGTEGELEVAVPMGVFQFGEAKRALRIKIGKNPTEDVEFLAKDDILESQVPYPGTNVARLYSNFAKNDTQNFSSFQSALKSARTLDRILRAAGWDSV